MHNDTIKVANKIITADDLLEIFEKMHLELLECNKKYENEKLKNQNLDYDQQVWTLKDYSGTLKFSVDFHDDTSSTFDDYDYFISIFNTRLHEIKSIIVSYYIMYWEQDKSYDSEYFHQKIDMYIREESAEIDSDLSSKSNLMVDVYNLIKNKILNAPEKYDSTIKNKNKIMLTIEFAIGFILSIIVMTILLLLPTLRNIFANSYVLYPIANILLGLLFGSLFCSSKLSHLYSNISPERVYAGYNESTYESIYKDDIKDYKEKSEILIGKNSNNMKYRNEINELYNKYKKYIPYELLIILLISVIVIFLK